jgi:uncharacterized membrane protein YbaN (DUF454 family)
MSNDAESRMSTSRKIKNALWTTAGFIFLGLGLIGIAVPLLPTTPFLLLAAWCFFHGSPRMHNWMLNHRWFGDIIRNFQEKKGIPLKAKIIAISMIWISIGFSMIFIIDVLLLHILLAGIAAAVTIYILSFKTL